MTPEHTSAESTKLTCPDCGGVLERLVEGNLVQYRCRVGHMYSPEAALAVHSEREENTLWTAVVILLEGAELAEEISKIAGIPNAAELRDLGASKRLLLERAKKIVLDFPRLTQR
jgi:two-component system, chemotaxis family, protein-glutamate methylesterase/glutaminase